MPKSEFRNGMQLDDALRQLAHDPAAPLDPFELGLRLAADEYPDLDVPVYLARVDELADRLAPKLSGSLLRKVTTLAAFLFESEGFAGNDADYYDARNSYLNDVLDRRLGIPLTLSLLAGAVGTRCGLDVVGVGLPGHFVAKASEDGAEVIFDPFGGGRVLDRDGCAELVRQATGQPFAATDDAVCACPPGLVLVRMLSNLKGVYLKRGDFGRAARVMGRLVTLRPDDPTQRRDLGVTLVHAGRPGASLGHLGAYLAAVPDAADFDAVAEFRKRARAAVAKWN
jgi:regulator of sirC expression with transglutaminase-like and TPR domain